MSTKYTKTTSTCTECLKEYDYEYYILPRCSSEDTLYCPWCHKRIRFSRWCRYGRTWKVVDDVNNPLDKPK